MIQSSSTMANEKENYSAFSSKQKLLIVLLTTFTGFLGPISGNIYIPLIKLTAEKFHTSIKVINGTVSVFMAVFAIAPLVWSLLADSTGRKPILNIALCIFVIANILLALIPANVWSLYLLRILQAVGASTMAVGIGCIADISEPKRRATFISYYMIGPQLGPILGPIVGILGAKTNWRWNFGLLAILGLVSFTLNVCFLPETLRSLVGNGSVVSESLFQGNFVRSNEIIESKYPKQRKDIRNYYKALCQLPVLLCSLSGGIVFAAFYAMILSFSKALSTDYGYSDIDVCICFLCPGFALVSGSIITGRVSDYLRSNSGGNNGPEKRFFIQLIGQLVFLAALFSYAWLISSHVPVGYLFISVFFGAFSMSAVLITNTTYLSEFSKAQLATFVSIGNFFRNVGATISSASVEPLTKVIGYGWCISIFSFSVIPSILCTILIISFGKRWRKQACNE